MTMNRVNKITVAVDNGMVSAKLYKTNKLVRALAQSEIIDLGFIADPNATITKLREDVRSFLQTDAIADIGCYYEAKQCTTMVDMTDESAIMDRATELVDHDLEQWCKKMELDSYTVVALQVDGTDGKDSHYANGKWAWGEISMEVHVVKGDEKAIVMMDARIVSGQIAKPKMINEHKYNYSGFVAEVAEEIPSFKAQVKAPTSKKATASDLIAKLAKMELTEDDKTQLAELIK